jgi:N-acetylmuramoyl-L-alanine amidase
MADEGIWIEVQQGESAESIAFRHGHIVETVWKHSENAALRELRGDPHILQPGDRLFVPPLQPGSVRCRTGATHRFRRHGVPSRITMVLSVGGNPLADLPYRLELPGETRTGRTGPDGRISVPVAPNVGSGTLVVDPEGINLSIPLGMRHLDPITEVSGLQGRLKNLGFYSGEVDGHFGPLTLLALQRFQFAHGLDTTGLFDDALRNRLLEIHGC